MADTMYTGPSHKAVKRSAGDLHIELLLVADKFMHDTHGEDLQNFLMSVTNVVCVEIVYSNTLHHQKE